MSETTLARIKTIVAEQMGVNEDKILSSSTFTDDLGADSLDQVELVMAIEETFGVDIPDDASEKFRTVQDVLDYLEARA